MSGEPVHRRVQRQCDEFIDELLDVSGVTLHRELGLRDGSANEGLLWGALFRAHSALRL